MIWLKSIYFQVKGINYSLESFIGTPNEKTSKFLDSLQKNKNDVSVSRCESYKFNKNWSTASHLIWNTGNITISMCDIFGTRWLSSFSFADGMAAGSATPFPWRTVIGQSKNCPMAAWPLLFERTCTVHGWMGTWIFQLHCSW